MPKYKIRKLIDRSTGNGVFHGDLAYGRCNGRVPLKGQDFTAQISGDGTPRNIPVAPLVLVRRRDPRMWAKDKQLKKTKRKTGHSQTMVNYIISQYLRTNLKSNFHLKVGGMSI